MNLSEWAARMLQTQSELMRIAQEYQEEHDINHTSMHTTQLYPVLLQHRSVSPQDTTCKIFVR